MPWPKRELGGAGGDSHSVAAGELCLSVQRAGRSQSGWNIYVVLWRVEVKVGQAGRVGDRLTVDFDILPEVPLFCVVYILKLFL